MRETTHESSKHTESLESARTVSRESKLTKIRLVSKNMKKKLLVPMLFAIIMMMAVGAQGALAASPWWHLSTNLRPANIPVGGEDTVVVRAVNLGNQTTSGLSKVSDLLPAGLTVAEEEVGGEMVPKVSFFAFSKSTGNENIASALCSVSGQHVSCATEPTPGAYEAFIQKFLEEPPFNEPPFNEPPLREVIRETVEASHPKSKFEEEFTVEPIQPYEDLELRIAVKDEGLASRRTERRSDQGGPTLKRSVPIGSDAAFGPEEFAMAPEEEGGGVDLQAGLRLYQLTTNFDLNQSSDPEHLPALAQPALQPAAGLGSATRRCCRSVRTSTDSSIFRLMAAGTQAPTWMSLVRDPPNRRYLRCSRP